MANTTWYGDGLSTATVGSRTVTGTDTGWLTPVAGLTPIKAGDKYGIHVGRPIVIEQIISDTELLLADDWPGPAQTDAPYKVELTSPTIAAVEAMRRFLAALSNGNLDSLSELTVGTDDIPIGIGPGVFSTINKAALVQGVEYDAFVANLAGRAAYNGAAQGFAVLVIDIGDGRSALYFKNSATSGDWSAPSYVTGPAGPAGVTWRGSYSAGTAYVVRDIVQFGGSVWYAKVATTGNAPPTLPTTENTQWILFARSGTAGVVDRGTYSGATAYEANDIVLNNGSTWLALQPTTGNAPPTLPTESNAYWRLLARKGTDGSGTGDVVGPAGGVADGDISAFDGATGKLIKLAETPTSTMLGRSTAGTGKIERLTPAQARQVLGGWEFINAFSLDGLSLLDVTGLSPFIALRMSYHVIMNAQGSFNLRYSSDNGATFYADSDEHRFTLQQGNFNASTNTKANQMDDGAAAWFPIGDHNATGLSTTGSAVLINFNKPRNTIGECHGILYQNSENRVIRHLGDFDKRAVAMNAFRLALTVATTIQQGRLYLEGMRG